MIELKGINKKFKQEIFRGLNYKFQLSGHIYGIKGDSGSGKTTLLNILFGLDNNYEGNYTIDGLDAKSLNWSKERETIIQLVSQNFSLFEEMNVSENIRLATNNLIDEAYFEQLVTSLRVDEILKKKVRNLSGGEKQRVAIARALIHQPKYLLLDEPTSNLDDINIDNLLEQLTFIKELGITIIVVSHNDYFLDACDTLLEIKNLTLETIRENDNSTEYISKTRTKKNKITSYSITSYRRNFVRNIIPNILKLATMTLLIIFFISQNIKFFDVFSPMNKKDDRVLEVVLRASTASTNDGVTSVKVDQNMITLKAKDIDKVKKLKNVEHLELLNHNADNCEITDTNGYLSAEHINKKDLPMSVKRYATYAALPDNLPIQFNQLIVSNKMRENYHGSSEGNMRITNGKLPKEDSNEILISDAYALYLASNMDIEVEKLIGKTIELETNKVIDNQEVKANKQKYIISGIYLSDYANTCLERYIVYTSYVNKPIKDNEKLKLLYDKNYYQDAIKKQVNGKPIYADAPMYKSFEIMQSNIGTGYTAMAILVDDTKNIDKVVEELKSIFPSISQNTMMVIKGDIYTSTKVKKADDLVMQATIYALVGFVIFLLIRFDDIKRTKRNFAKLYTQGYSKENILLINIIKETIKAITSIIGIYTMIYIGWRSMLLIMPELIKYYDIMHNLFTFKIFSIFALIMIIIHLLFIATITLVTSDKNLVKNLKNK
ncbi:MAG: ATP-binding cassette domain-containing protein [Erysipelotrichaceae bacterium]